MQGLAQSLLFSQGVVHSLVVVACYSDYSSNHNSDCYDYLGYPSNPGLDYDFCTCSDKHCLHTVLDSIDSHIEPALLSSALTNTLEYYANHHKICRFLMDCSK